MERIDFDISGHVALVSGASRGIGRDLAEAFGAAGATVAVGVRQALDADETVRAVEAAGGSAFAVELDVTDTRAIPETVDAILARTGRIDILVNNAGLGENHDSLEVSEADWDQLMNVNLKGLFFLTQAVARSMIDRGYGRIVSLSSQAGLVGIPRHAVYSASKGGVNMLTKVLALEWAHLGVTVNAIAPTFIRTPGTADRLDDPEISADILRRIPAGKFGTTADVAAAALYLASPAAGLVTGTVLPVDGGWTAQ